MSAVLAAPADAAPDAAGDAAGNAVDTAARYRDHLLTTLGAAPAVRVAPPAEHPARAWARSGLMTLCGAADGAPQLSVLPLTALADGALAALASLAPHADLADLRGAALLAERAALMGLQRRGATSAGGACRLLRAGDGLLALSLPRDDDWSLLPAWLEAPAADWAAVEAAVREREVDDLVARGRLLGLALAASRVEAAPAPWLRVHAGRSWPGVLAARPAPLVVDLSSLWAGPLCSQLLQRCGAEVVKVESTARPDGARRGSAPFFDLLHAGKRSVALDLHSARGRAQLLALLRRADIVIEASRPRALRQMGIDAEALLREKLDLSWIAIHGYGRDEPQAQWIAYGDDAGVAAGLCAAQQLAGAAPCFIGDAIADPLTGLHAALAAWASHAGGGGRLIALSLHEVARQAVQFEAPRDAAGWCARRRDWQAELRPGDERAPQARRVHATAAAFGADTDAVLARLGAC